MNGGRRAARALPRLACGAGRGALAWNAAGLLGAALVGAGLVHLLAYHVPWDVPAGPRWGSTVLALLARCPLVGPLGLIVALAVLAPLLALRELWRLERLNTALAHLVAATRPRHAHLRLTPSCGEVVPRSPWRLAGFVVALLVLQGLLLVVAGALCPMPMQTTMVMHGVSMTMAMTPLLPLGPLQLLVAVGLGLLLWRVERRLTRLRTQIAARLSLLRGAAHHGAAPPIPDRAPRPPLARYVYVLFARPPPLAA